MSLRERITSLQQIPRFGILFRRGGAVLLAIIIGILAILTFPTS